MAQPSPQAIAAAQQAATRQQQEKLQLQGLASTLQRQQQMQPPSGDVMAQGVAAAQRGFEPDRVTGGGRAIAVRNKGGYSLYGRNTPEARRLMQAGQRLRGTPNQQGQSQSQQPQAVPDPTLQQQSQGRAAIAPGGTMTDEERMRVFGIQSATGQTAQEQPLQPSILPDPSTTDLTPREPTRPTPNQPKPPQQRGGMFVQGGPSPQQDRMVPPKVASNLNIYLARQQDIPEGVRPFIENIARHPDTTPNQLVNEIDNAISGQQEGAAMQKRLATLQAVKDRVSPEDFTILKSLAQNPEITDNWFGLRAVRMAGLEDSLGSFLRQGAQQQATPVNQESNMLDSVLQTVTGREQGAAPPRPSSQRGQVDQDTWDEAYRAIGFDGSEPLTPAIRRQAQDYLIQQGVIDG